MIYIYSEDIVLQVTHAVTAEQQIDLKLIK